MLGQMIHDHVDELDLVGVVFGSVEEDGRCFLCSTPIQTNERPDEEPEADRRWSVTDSRNHPGISMPSRIVRYPARAYATATKWDESAL